MATSNTSEQPAWSESDEAEQTQGHRRPSRRIDAEQPLDIATRAAARDRRTKARIG